MGHGTLPTVEAVDFARLDRDDMEAALERKLLPFAPPTPRGQPRQFDSFHLTALTVYSQLRLHEVAPKWASHIADEVYRQITADHSIMRLSAWKIVRSDQDPELVVAQAAPVPGAIELFRFEIADIRMEALEAIRVAQRERQTAKRRAAMT